MRRLTPNAVVHRVRLGETGETCCLDHFGPDGPEASHEGTIIYINTDHPLYLRNSHRRETQTLHLTRLLTQEITLMKEPRTPRQAFERQSKLLRDGFADDEKQAIPRYLVPDSPRLKNRRGVTQSSWHRACIASGSRRGEVCHREAPPSGPWRSSGPVGGIL